MKQIDRQKSLLHFLRQHKKMGEYLVDNVNSDISDVISPKIWENSVEWILYPVKVELMKNIKYGKD